MRKLISLGLATAMVASMAVTAFAADTAKDTAVPIEGTVAIRWTAGQSVTIKANNVTITETSVKTAAEKVSDALGSDFDVHAYYVGAKAAVIDHEDAGFNGIDIVPKAGATGTIMSANVVSGGGVTGGTTTGSSVYAKGYWQENLDGIFEHQFALVEDGDWNTKDGVKPGTSIYFMLRDDFKDTSDFKFDVSKGENAKQIKKISVVEKRWGSELVNLANGKAVADTDGRHAFVKVELNDNMTDKEYKISFDFKVKVDAKGGVTIDGRHYDKGAVSKKWEEIGSTWVYNVTETTDDREFLAGEDGIMVKPVKNEENTVLWTDQNNDLARLTFTADSDVAKYFPKLSTKWPNATYAQLFDDQDAFVFDFVGNPAISSTSRAVLELFCPFLDDEDEYTIDPESVVIYQVADDATLAASTEVELAKAILDGRLIDVTDKFTAGENEDGDFVYTTKTRTLGTYIIAEKAPSEEAFDEAEGEANDEKPADETGKTNPGTGR